jgi:hypothetical protein
MFAAGTPFPAPRYGSAVTEADALAALQQQSPELRALVLIGADGQVRASTLEDPGPLAGAAAELLDAAAALRPGGERTVVRLAVATEDGAVFAVADGGLTLVAAGGRDAAAPLALHDLGACLAALDRNGDAPS